MEKNDTKDDDESDYETDEDDEQEESPFTSPAWQNFHYFYQCNIPDEVSPYMRKLKQNGKFVFNLP